MTILTSRLPRSLGATVRDDTALVDRVLTPGLDHFSIVPRLLQFRRYFDRRRGVFDVVQCDLLAWEFLLSIRYLKSLGLPIAVEMVLLGGDDPLSTSRERFGSLKLGLLKNVDLWIGLSSAFLPRVREAGIPEDRFRLVYPGVDVRTYRPLSPEARRATRSRLGLPMNARIVVSVGSVIRRKGFDRLLRAWESYRPRTGRDLLVMVGPATEAEGLRGPDVTFAGTLVDRSRVANLAGTVRWVGRAENVQEYLGAADLFVFLSRQEGLGIVILEALACGLPCLVSPLDGIAAEIVSDGRTGIIVKDPDNAAAVASCVKQLLEQPGAQASMAEAARRTIVERFSFEARADVLASLYRELVARPRTASRP
ncbi:MAG: hypothetical protein AUG09_07025 [Acidobacteria bacterium 13_1_20CM_2_68_7]|nr:MAG: hypothetical protein AUG09_07025 [Acidobacteria bacterium 13_1_20CM_2_68_7]